MTDAPRIPIAEVSAALWYEIDQRSKLQGCGVEGWTVEEILHAVRHLSLDRVCLAQLLQALSPYVYLRARTHLGWAYIIAR